MIVQRKIGFDLCRVINWHGNMKVWCWFDFDDLVCDTGTYKKQVCKSLFGKEVPKELLDSSKLNQAGLTEDQYREIQRVVYRGSDSTPLPISGAIESLKLLIEKGVKPGILTARLEIKELLPVQRFFENAGLKIPIIGTGYFACQNGVKARILEKVGARFYFDDDRKMLRIVAMFKKYNIKLGLFDPINYHDIPEGAQLFQNWDEITRTIITYLYEV